MEDCSNLMNNKRKRDSISDYIFEELQMFLRDEGSSFDIPTNFAQDIRTNTVNFEDAISDNESVCVSPSGRYRVPDEGKRIKNREHAKNSRLRKKVLLESLHDSAKALREENEQLRALIRTYEANNNNKPTVGAFPIPRSTKTSSSPSTHDKRQQLPQKIPSCLNYALNTITVGSSNTMA